MKNVNITDQSKALFIEYFNDAPNWNGTPCVGGNVTSNKEANGNLTQLKKEGLISTWFDEGHSWLEFTALGLEYAAEIGLEKQF